MKIAMAQINPVIADIEGNREKIISFIKKARQMNADIVVFPELAVIGYPPMDLLESKKLIDENLRSIEIILEHSHGIAVVCGYVDFDTENPPMLFNSAAFMYDKKILLRQHKTLLPTYDVFDESRYFSTAKKSAPVDFLGKKIGITICEDIWNTEFPDNSEFKENRHYDADPVSILAGTGADLIINISASPFVKGKNRAKTEMLKSISKKYSVDLVYVNQAGGNDSLIFDGNSITINKNGTIIGKCSGFEEELITTDLSSKDEIEFKVNDIEDVRNALVLGLRDYMKKCGFKKAVLGLSGGIDSALTAALAAEAAGAENVIGITMPSEYSSKGSIEDSVKLAKNLGIKIETVPIKNLFESYKNELSVLFKGLPEDTTEENIQARIRGNILMAMSNKTGALLLTTGNKSELATGYCTLYGDMSGGLAVISDIPKTLVYELARHINLEKEIIPVESIEKAPSAELRPGQKDQDTLPPYDILDRILELHIEHRKSSAEIIAEGFQRDMVLDILKKVNFNEYKRRQAAPGLKVTSKAFGTGRRIPMAQKFRP